MLCLDVPMCKMGTFSRVVIVCMFARTSWSRSFQPSLKLECGFDLRRIHRRIFGDVSVSSDGTVEQMVRQTDSVSLRRLSKGNFDSPDKFGPVRKSGAQRLGSTGHGHVTVTVCMGSTPPYSQGKVRKCRGGSWMQKFRCISGPMFLM
jgi:hypothetical protein